MYTYKYRHTTKTMGSKTICIVVWPPNYCFTIEFVYSFMYTVTRTHRSTSIICLQKKSEKLTSEDEIILYEQSRVEQNHIIKSYTIQKHSYTHRMARVWVYALCIWYIESREQINCWTTIYRTNKQQNNIVEQNTHTYEHNSHCCSSNECPPHSTIHSHIPVIRWTIEKRHWLEKLPTTRQYIDVHTTNVCIVRILFIRVIVYFFFPRLVALLRSVAQQHNTIFAKEKRKACSFIETLKNSSYLHFERIVHAFSGALDSQVYQHRYYFFFCLYWTSDQLRKHHWRITEKKKEYIDR